MQDLVTHDLKVPKSRNQRANERFVASLRAYVLVEMADQMRSDFENQVLPAAEKQGEEPADGVAVHKLMRQRDAFRLYSSMRCTAQEMVWRYGIDLLNPAAEALKEKAQTLAADQSRAQGTLTLNDSLAKPDYYDKVDVHLMPGNYDAHDRDVGPL
ncbi:MAG: hypothetical protein V2I48_14595, partial [Xanthomonadales bacterium]|nr:hypothetical protein [Xanthomonadales bacterium]